MSRLEPALRHRRRQLDSLALAIATERQSRDAVLAAAVDLEARRRGERGCGAPVPAAAEAWFAATANRLAALGKEREASEARLAGLRADAVQARARLNLLEQAAQQQRQSQRRSRERAAQAAMDDRTAAAWSQR